MPAFKVGDRVKCRVLLYDTVEQRHDVEGWVDGVVRGVKDAQATYRKRPMYKPSHRGPQKATKYAAGEVIYVIETPPTNFRRDGTPIQILQNYHPDHVKAA